MPRRKRQKSATGIYHVVMRGNNRQIIFETSRDYAKFLEIMEEYCADSETKILAYCLMDNHIHILIMEGEESVSNYIRKIATKFAKWYNYKYKRVGYLFQDRFRSEPVENIEYLLTVFRYIHQNPLKAGVVNSIKDYKWSSFHAYKNLDNSFVAIYDILALFVTLDECIEFLNEAQFVRCLEHFPDNKMPDEELLCDLLKYTNFRSHSDFSRMSIRERNNLIVFMIKNYRIPVKQINRVTGFSIDVIQRIKKKIEKGEGHS